MCCRIGVRERRLYPDIAVTYLDRNGRYVVRPEVECASAFQIEARMMPMTGQDTILDAPLFEREAHMGATVIEGADAPVIVDDEDRTVVTTHNGPPLCLSSVRLPARAKSLFVASMRYLPNLLFGSL
jgi:hypothetical protein